jgi:hypothetical protein
MSIRTDNRTLKVPHPIGESQSGVFNLEATGDELLILQITGTAGNFSFGYMPGGPYITYPAGTTSQYDVKHPFVGDIYYSTDANFNGTVTFSIAGYTNYRK